MSELGPSSIRISPVPTFNRRNLVDVELFLAALARAKESQPDSPATADAPARGPASSADAPQNNDAATVASQSSTKTSASSAPRNYQSAIPDPVTGTVEVFDPELLLRYFETRRQDIPQPVVGVPFVLPYQAQPPLVMDSKATYNQSEGGTQSEAPSQ
jgi:hypothetical protein